MNAAAGLVLDAPARHWTPMPTVPPAPPCLANGASPEPGPAAASNPANANVAAPAAAAAEAAGPQATAGTLRGRHAMLLGWAFTLFNSVRVVAYLPTVWAIFVSGDSSQHSLWTWCTWFGANLTMALWLRERNGGRFCRAAAVNLGNASMCGLTLALIVWFRL